VAATVTATETAQIDHARQNAAGGISHLLTRVFP